MLSLFKIKKEKTTVLEEKIDGVALKYRKHHASRRIKISIRPNLPVLITLPKRMSFSRAQEFAHSQIKWIKENVEKYPCAQNPLEIKHLRKDAKAYLPKKVEELAQKHGFHYKKVSIKAMRTRWGSCSYFNNINLNLNLMKLEDELVEYVILHELCHTVEKNHGPRFWELLENHLPNAQEFRKKLRKAASLS